MPELRVQFSRTGAVRYLSHLDVFRTFARAFARAGVPLSYSQGFNPHPYISIVHPLSVGVEGLNELLDVSVTRIDTDLSPEILNATLPAGLRVLDVYEPTAPLKAIELADYLFEFLYDGEVPQASDMEAFFSAEEIIITKKTKGGIKPVNLRPCFTHFAAERAEGMLQCRVTLDARNSPINPKYFVQALDMSPLKPDFARFTRLRFVGIDGATFR